LGLKVTEGRWDGKLEDMGMGLFKRFGFTAVFLNIVVGVEVHTVPLGGVIGGVVIVVVNIELAVEEIFACACCCLLASSGSGIAIKCLGLNKIIKYKN
jgi:hypothetical protein